MERLRANNPMIYSPMVAASPPSASSGWAKTVKDIFAGTCGGIAVTLVGHPFDTIKVRLQTQPSANPVYSGVLDCVKKTVAWEGLPGLYKGVTSPLAGQMFFRATLFGAFGSSKRYFGRDAEGRPRQLTDADYYKAGAVTGFVAAFIEAPIDFYKSQIQVQVIRSKADPNYKPPYTTVAGVVKATIQTNGFRGPFQGLGITIIRNTPANAVYLGSFEVIKRRAAEYYGCTVPELDTFTTFGAAGIGGLLYWLAVFPIDVIKSAIMTDNIIPSKRQYPDILTTTKKLWADGGVSRFYRGFSPCLMRAIPANGVMLVTVDKVNVLLNKL